MADIAMLVAEEYERRVKGASRGGGDDDVHVHDHDQRMIMMMKNKIDFNWVAERIKNETHTFVSNYKWLLEPKSQIGLAASNGVFSP